MAFVIPRHARSCRVYPLTPYHFPLHVRFTSVTRLFQPLHPFTWRDRSLPDRFIRYATVTQPLHVRHTRVDVRHIRYTHSCPLHPFNPISGSVNSGRAFLLRADAI